VPVPSTIEAGVVLPLIKQPQSLLDEEVAA